MHHTHSGTWSPIYETLSITVFHFAMTVLGSCLAHIPFTPKASIIATTPCSIVNTQCEFSIKNILH